MPELPDVEVFKQYADSTALHQKIIDVKVLCKEMLEEISASKTKSVLERKEFVSTKRNGKYLFMRTGVTNGLCCTSE